MSGQFHDFALDGFILTGEDEYGCIWTVEQPLSGWFTFDGQVASSAELRAQTAGSWRGVNLRGGRVITVPGKVFAPSPSALEAAGRRLSTLLPRGAFGEFAGQSEAGTYTSLVQVDEAPLFDVIGPSQAAYELVLGSEDPLLYGPAWWDSTTLASAAVGTGRTWLRTWPRDWGVPEGVTPGSVSVPNAGTAPYWPVLRLDGPVENAVIRCVETGDSLKVNTSITSGFFDLDCGERHFTYGANADDIRNFVEVSGSALAIPPGGATLTLEADSGTADTTLTVNGYESAWD